MTVCDWNDPYYESPSLWVCSEGLFVVIGGDMSHLQFIRERFDHSVAQFMERYNEKQTRTDRRIENYYEKIRTGKQEKPFHELIIQIGNRDDTGSGTEIGEQAKAALDEYFQGFRERNPNLYVFSAHLHMDEATPHIHIDFVPFITGSKRGLDTRVSLKQALAAQGFRGGTRGATEWNQWVLSEKKELANAMFRHGFEWEQKGTHEEHLSVIDYKKQERTKELAAVEEKLTDKSEEFKVLAKRINNLEDSEQSYHDMEEKLAHDPEYQLPEPQGLMSAKSYKAKFAEPLVKRLKKLVKSLLVRYFKVQDNYYRLNKTNGELYRDNEGLARSNDRLKEENTALRKQNRDYALLRKVFGSKQIDDLVAQAKEAQRAKRQQKQRNYER